MGCKAVLKKFVGVTHHPTPQTGLVCNGIARGVTQAKREVRSVCGHSL